MNDFIGLLKNSPTGYITGIFRSDLCVDDVENIEKTYSGESDKKYAYNAINLVFEKEGVLLGNLRIPLTKENHDSGVIRSDENAPTLDSAAYGGLTLHNDSANFSDVDPWPKCTIELSFDISTDIGTFRAWVAKASFAEKARILGISLEDLGLSVRAFNCLKATKICSVLELVQYTEKEMMTFRNFGQKSLVEIDEALKDKGLHFGMTFNR